MLTLQVKEQIIENLTPDEKFIRGTVGAKCQIKFDEFWGKYEKTVVFQRKCQKPINIIVNELDNEIEIPYEILEKHGKFKIGVFGIIENEVLPTLWSKDIEILCGTDTHGTNPQTYTPSEIDQLRLSKQNKLIAGQGIKIEQDVISIDGEIGVQPDWNQNDPTAPDYVKNRTHYDETRLITVADETIDCTAEADEYIGNSKFEIVIGQTYAVIFNGTEYQCTGFYDEGFPTLGSTYSSVVEGAAEALPFCIWHYPSNAGDEDTSVGNTLYLYPKVKGNHTIQVIAIVEEIKKIDSKFLPDELYSKPNWNQNDPTQSDYIANRTHFDITLEDIENKGEYTETFYGTWACQEGYYFKVSDLVLPMDILLAGVKYEEDGSYKGQKLLINENINVYEDLGMIGCGRLGNWIQPAFVVVYDERKATQTHNTNITNGIYFGNGSDLSSDVNVWVTKIIFPEVKKLDEKYLPEFATVAKSGNYSDLKNKPDLNNFADKDYVDEKSLSTMEQSQKYADSCDIREISAGGFVAMFDIATKEKMNVEISNIKGAQELKFYDKVVGYFPENYNMILTGGTGIADPDTVNLGFECYDDQYYLVNYNVISQNRNSLMCQTIFTVEKLVKYVEFAVWGEYNQREQILCELLPNVEYQLLYNIKCGRVYEDVYGECFEGTAYDITIIKSSDISNQTIISNSTGTTNLKTHGVFSIPTTICVPKNIDAGLAFKGKYLASKTYDFIKDEIESKTTLSIEGNDDLPTPILKLDDGSEPITLYWDGTVATSISSTATGTENDPIIINTAAELAYLINKATNTTGKYYKIADGISAIVLQSSDKSKDITALSTEAAVKTYFESNNCTVWRGSVASNTFDGNFDGNGATIYGLYIKETSYSGFFSTLGGNSTIKNLTIKNSYFKTGWYAGVVASNIADNGGGTVAIEKCVITNCCVVGKYNVETDTGVKSIPNQCIGLILGRANNVDNTTISISNCLVYGNNVHYEYDNSINNYLIGLSKDTKIKTSVMLNFADLVFNGIPAETLNVYTDQEITSVEDIKGDKAIVKMPNLAWGIDWFVPKTYAGKAAPFDFLQLSQATLLNSINNNAIEINNKTITSTSTKEKYTFDWNAMYLIKSNSGNIDIQLYNSDTNGVIVDGDGNNLPKSSLCLLILPKSSTGVGGGRLCMFVGMTGNFSIMNPNVLKGLQFNVASGDVYFTPSTSASIFKIAL